MFELFSGFSQYKAKDTFCSGLAYSFQAELVQAEHLEGCFLQNSLMTQSEIWKGCDMFWTENQDSKFEVHHFWGCAAHTTVSVYKKRWEFFTHEALCTGFLTFQKK